MYDALRLRSFLILALFTSMTTTAFANGGVDTPQGTTDLPLLVQGVQIMDLTNTGVTSYQPFTVEGCQALSINANQIWKSSYCGDSAMYLQWSGGGNVDVGNGLWAWKALQNTTNYGGTPQIWVNGDNHWGGGIAISDDGGFYDYNDGWVTFNGSTGLRIAGNNGSGSWGNLLAIGNITAQGELIGTMSSGGYGQMRMVGGSYGALFRNDGTNTYLLFTNPNDQYGSWNGLRPLWFDNADNNVHSAGSMQVGDDGNACTGSNAGAIRFSGGQFLGCNGSSWVVFQQGLPPNSHVWYARPDSGVGTPCSFTTDASGVPTAMTYSNTTSGWQVESYQYGQTVNQTTYIGGVTSNNLSLYTTVCTVSAQGMSYSTFYAHFPYTGPNDDQSNYTRVVPWTHN